jgi:hypothetical protein
VEKPPEQPMQQLLSYALVYGFADLLSKSGIPFFGSGAINAKI